MNFASSMLIGLALGQMYQNNRNLANQRMNLGNVYSSRSSSKSNVKSNVSYGLNKYLIRYEAMKNPELLQAVENFKNLIEKNMTDIGEKAEKAIQQNLKLAQNLYKNYLAQEKQLKAVGFNLGEYKHLSFDDSRDKLSVYTFIEGEEITKEMLQQNGYLESVLKNKLAELDKYLNTEKYSSYDEELKVVQGRIKTLENAKLLLKMSTKRQDNLRQLQTREAVILSIKNEKNRLNGLINYLHNATDKQKQDLISFADNVNQLKNLADESFEFIETLKSVNSRYNSDLVDYREFLTQAVEETKDTKDGKIIANFVDKFSDFYINNMEECNSLGMVQNEDSFSFMDNLVYKNLLTQSIREMVDMKLDELKNTNDSEMTESETFEE